MIKKFLNNENGNVTVLVALMMLILVSMMAFVTDFGIVFAEKAKLSKAMDAAILAGGAELPRRTDLARSIMEEYIVLNGVSLDQVEITIASDGLSAEIVGTKPVEHYFAKLMGFDFTTITETSKVILGPARSVANGLRPFALTKYEFGYGDFVTLKQAAGDSFNGNFNAIALGGTGASDLLDNALYGYDGEIEVGDIIDTEPGNMASIITPLDTYIKSFNDTFETFDRGSGRIWTVPVFESLDVEGRDGVIVIGFAQVYVIEIGQQTGLAEIKGRFLEYVSNGEIDFELEDTGVYAMKLIN